MDLKTKIAACVIGGVIGGTGCVVGGYYIGENVRVQQVEKAKEDGIKQGYDQGFQEALENKILLEKIIAEYKSTCETQKVELDGAKNQIQILTDNNNEIIAQRDKLTADKQALQEKVGGLETENVTLREEKSNLQISIASDKAEIERLKASGEDKDEDIARLENRVAQNEILLESYEKTFQANLNSMMETNNKIIEMSNQIARMSNQVQNNNSVVSSLNATIAKLEKTVAFYEQFIAQMENGDQVVATFKFDDSVWNIQIVSKGTFAAPSTPTSTDHVIFNYWMLNGERVDPATLPLTANTMFIANVTYKYDVNFVVDGQQKGETQLVVEDGKATLPTVPTKEGYIFDGWTLDGINVVDVANMSITTNTTFVAKFTQLHAVNFVDDEGNSLATQSVKNGEFAEDVPVESTTHKVFNGFKLNGVFVNVAEIPVTGSMTFVADYTYKYDVKFMNGDEQLGETQLVVKGSKATVPTNPTKEGYDFLGWSLNDVDVIENIETFAITENTIFKAVFDNHKYVVSLFGDTFGAPSVASVRVAPGSKIGMENVLKLIEAAEKRENYRLIGFKDNVFFNANEYTFDEFAEIVIDGDMSFKYNYLSLLYEYNFYDVDRNLVSHMVVHYDDLSTFEIPVVNKDGIEAQWGLNGQIYVTEEYIRSHAGNYYAYI